MSNPLQARSASAAVGQVSPPIYNSVCRRYTNTPALYFLTASHILIAVQLRLTCPTQLPSSCDAYTICVPTAHHGGLWGRMSASCASRWSACRRQLRIVVWFHHTAVTPKMCIKGRTMPWTYAPSGRIHAFNGRAFFGVYTGLWYAVCPVA